MLVRLSYKKTYMAVTNATTKSESPLISAPW